MYYALQERRASALNVAARGDAMWKTKLVVPVTDCAELKSIVLMLLHDQRYGGMLIADAIEC